jgi:hypothetical protein
MGNFVHDGQFCSKLSATSALMNLGFYNITSCLVSQKFSDRWNEERGPKCAKILTRGRSCTMFLLLDTENMAPYHKPGGIVQASVEGEKSTRGWRWWNSPGWRKMSVEDGSGW